MGFILLLACLASDWRIYYVILKSSVYCEFPAGFLKVLEKILEYPPVVFKEESSQAWNSGVLGIKCAIGDDNLKVSSDMT